MESMTSDLIIGFLKGSLNEKEINQFYDWVNETPENKQIFFEAKMVYDACLSKGNNIDMDQSWQRLLEKKQKQAPRKNIHSLPESSGLCSGGDDSCCFNFRSLLVVG